MLRRYILLLLLLPATVSACGIETAEGPGSSVAEGTAESAPAVGDNTNRQGASADVVVQSCDRGDFGMITATLAVTNSTNSPKSYLITLSADTAAGNRLAELNAVANSVQPSQTAAVEALGTIAGDPAPGELTCRVVNVNRL